MISPDHMRHMDRLPSLLPQQDGSRSVDGGFSDSGDFSVVRGIAEILVQLHFGPLETQRLVELLPVQLTARSDGDMHHCGGCRYSSI